ncbi:MAG: hypothetical protein JNJ73_10845 [Hyphomonadaceae bacterium]|nr:hypothetical protein [Hyphomonadaceae bacterium]
MKNVYRRFAAAAAMGAALLGASAAWAQTHEGTVAGGAKWSVEVPDTWNGVLVTFGNPNREVGAALQALGFAVGRFTARPGIGLRPREWANDQLASLRDIRTRVAPRTVISVGYSGPGLVNTMLSEDAGGLTQGAVTGCALSVGLRNLFNAHLDGAHALSVLLAPGETIKLVDFTDALEINRTVAQMRAAVMRAQQTPEGRARIALVGAFGLMPTWFDPGAAPPGADDFDAQEIAQYNHLTALNVNGIESAVVEGGAQRPEGGWPAVTAGGNLSFIAHSRFDIERLAGGNTSSNVGVDYARLLAQAPTRRQVEALYARAGLDLAADLRRLSEAANISAAPGAIAWTAQNATASGRLRVPMLSIRPISDIAGPQYDTWYAARVREAGKSGLLRQAYVQEVGHCRFTPAEATAAVLTVKARIESGRWGDSTAPQALQALAESLNLGRAAFVSFTPGPFLSDRDRAP